MAGNNLVSRDSLKKYLEGIDVDTSNFDNDEIDYQYLNRLTKRDGSQLTNTEKEQGNIALKQYLGDYQASQIKNEGISQAENQARQDIAYNDYVNSKLAKYLNIAEENNGTAGYTGITQGNRIQLANQEKNIASQIEQNKQSTIKDYLNTYGNQLMTNSMNALDQETSFQAAQDAKDESKAYTIQEYAKAMLGKYNYSTEEDGLDYYDTSVRDAVAKYVNESNISDEAKQEIMRNVDSQNNFKDYTAENKQRVINGTIGIINNYKPVKDKTDGKDYYHTNVLKEIETYVNGQQISDEAKQEILNDIKSKYNFKDNVNLGTNGGQLLRGSDGKDVEFKTSTGRSLQDAKNKNQTFYFNLNGTRHSVRGSGYTANNANDYIANQQMFNSLSDYRTTKVLEQLQNMEDGEALCWYDDSFSTNPPERYIVWKKGGKYYTFNKSGKGNGTKNRVGDNEKGFLALYQLLENKGSVLNDLVKK